MKFSSVFATLAAVLPALVSEADAVVTATGSQKLSVVTKAASTALVIAGNVEAEVEKAKPAIQQIVSLFADFKHDLADLVDAVEGKPATTAAAGATTPPASSATP